MITIADVEAARERISGRVYSTPINRSHLIDELCGAEIYFKCENLQRGGSFKIRGATNKLLSTGEAVRRRGVVAFSSGNHAQAVALASRSLEVDATIVMPSDAPRPKYEATVSYGARVIQYDRRRENREQVASDICEREGRILVPPYDDPEVMAGQGTVALELLEQVPDLDAVLLPIGGGGLSAGVATVISARSPATKVYAVEPEDANDTALSVAAQTRVEIPPPETIADGARHTAPGALTFPIVQRLVERVITVPDWRLVEAMRLLLERMKLLVEPTGALGLAAMLNGEVPKQHRRIGVVLSGGNVDLSVLSNLIGRDGAA
jgi:threonine dehydratase